MAADFVLQDYLDIAGIYKQHFKYKTALEYVEMVEKELPDNVQIKAAKQAILAVYTPGVRIPAVDVVELDLSEPIFEVYEDSQTELLAENETDETFDESETSNTIENTETEQISDSEKISENTPEIIVKDAKYYNIMGVKLYRQGQIKQAIVCFETAVSLDNSDKYTYNNLAIAYWADCDEKNAVKNFKKAYKIDKNYTEPLLNLALLYKKKGDNKKFIYYSQKALNQTREAGFCEEDADN